MRPSVDYSPPPGYASGEVIAVGRAFATFEVHLGSDVFVCKRTRMVAQDVGGAAAEQLAREAQILERLAGRGVPVVHRSGVDAHGQFVVMEKATGGPLGAWSKGDAAARLAAAAHIAFTALAAVHEASDDAGLLGIIHGDVTPSNVLLSPDASRAWIVDFGLASGRDWPPTQGGAFAGTLAFAPPELARGERLDVRADVFALAASLVATAVGREPHPRGETAIAAQLARAAEESLDAFVAAAAAELGPDAHAQATLAALAPCLAFDSASRPATARAVLGLLETC